MKKIINFQRRKVTAQGLVEFALVLPMLLLLILGIIEAGRLLMIFSMTMASSREAARYGSAAGAINTTSITQRYKDCSGMRASARRIGQFAGIQDGNISIVYDRGPSTATIGHCNSTFTLTGGSGAWVNQGDRVVVQVVANYQPLLPLLTRFSSFPITSVTRRTIIKDVEVGGTPPPPVPPKVGFATSSQTHSESVGEVTLRVQMNAASSKAVTIPFSLSGSAVEGVGKDYTVTTTSPVFISPGDMYIDIVFEINDDVMDEDDETIVVSMGTPTNADQISPTVHTITITDNDDPPFVSFTTAAQSQPEDQDIIINLQLSDPSSKEITVYYSVAGTASQGAGADFTITSSPVTIPPESTSVSIIATVFDDISDEYDETIILTLGDLFNAREGSPSAHVATIIDNDLPPFVSFSWAESSLEETVGSAVVQLQLSEVSSKDITVPFTVKGDAELDSDYSIDASPVSIPAGSLTGSIPLTILEDDDLTELDEKIIFTILTPVNARMGTPDVHTVTITKSTKTPTVSFISSSQTVGEGDTNSTVTVQVSLDKAAPRDVSVPFSLSGSALKGKDYDISSSPVIIPAGGATAEIVIDLVNDFLDEADETIIITMGIPKNAFKGAPGIHTVTVIDDDLTPSVFFTVESQTVSEGAGVLPVEIQLTAPSSLDVQVEISASGTATPADDYLISNSPILVPAGSTSVNFDVTLINDYVFESIEQVTLELSSPTNAILGGLNTHRIMINDDDPVCPAFSSIVFTGSGADKDTIVWTLENPYPLIPVRLLSVSITWPNDSMAGITSITFGSTGIYAGSNSPPYLIVENPVPLWSGVFISNQLMYKFDKNVTSLKGQFYEVSATFENCSPVNSTIASP